jgi:hypothetical protein
MENKDKRYEFSGFTFGSENWYNLSIRIANNANHGTSYTAQFDLELNQEERMALINLLMNPKETN